ncbi:MAG: phosphoglycerate mutase family protein [Bacteroidota bacterium]
MMFKLAIISICFFITTSVYASSKIYLIRHASVNIEKPGWSNAKEAQFYKERYNYTGILAFDRKEVLNKIENYKEIDTVFCSPQLRALQTAQILFEGKAFLRTSEHLKELDYPISTLPLIKLPVNIWLTMSRISWMAGNTANNKPSYQDRKENLEIFVDELIAYAEKNGISVVVAHGGVNRELIRILKKKGWKLEIRDGLGNLSVNCLSK